MTPSCMIDSKLADAIASADPEFSGPGIDPIDPARPLAAADGDSVPEDALNKPCGVTVGLMLSIPVWLLIGAFSYLIG